MRMFFIHIQKYFLLTLLLLLVCLFFYFHLYDYLSLSTIRKYHAAAEQWTMMHYKSAVGLYLLIFTLLIACGIPCATLLSLLGGFLFGNIAIIYATLGTTLGGLTLFLAVRTALGARIAASSVEWIKSAEQGFQQNAFSYILMLRLVPVFPCWISNVSAGMLNVPIGTFICATALGVFPATLIFTMMGRNLDKLLLAEHPFSLNTLLTPSMIFSLCGLAILGLFPVIYKYVKKR
ncbi:MAG: hypothetical protein EPO11_06400 [Gammaproteobacteria bacterium]|nr:MAG: hypothetical protein EPO11_06400 [Gammaproteobacteria bacterium]